MIALVLILLVAAGLTYLLVNEERPKPDLQVAFTFDLVKFNAGVRRAQAAFARLAPSAEQAAARMRDFARGYDL